MACSINLTSEKTALASSIVVEASLIFKKIKKLLATPEKIMEIVLQQHGDFFKTYPLVVRFMIMGYFDGFQFRRLLNQLAVKYCTEQEYFEHHGTYMARMEKLRHRNMTQFEQNKIKQNTIETLTAETKKFKEQINKAQEEIETKKRQFNDENRQELIQYYKNFDTDGTIECKCSNT